MNIQSNNAILREQQQLWIVPSLIASSVTIVIRSSLNNRIQVIMGIPRGEIMIMVNVAVKILGKDSQEARYNKRNR
jgi:hypothetical protein